LNEETKEYDFKKLEEIAGQMVRNLNRVIDVNLYPVPETKYSNLKHRPLGIGVQGLADVFCLMRYPFDSKEALALNEEIFETIYYGAMKASIELAKEYGTYETFKGSPLSQGQFQFDLWNKKPSDRYDWDKLRKEVMQYGARNSLLIACMPTASTSQIMGNNETIEPYTSNMYVRRTLSGEFIVSNKHMIKDLCNLGIWNKDLKDRVIANNGSIQNIEGIPDNIKRLYKTSWELKQKALMDLSVSRGPYVCQTQSLNLFFEEPTTKILTSAMFYAWKNGLKTGVYYVRSRPKTQAQQFTIDPKLIKNKELQEKQSKNIKKNVVCEDDVCTMCSG
jgi:ribonucleoside-diphosphate reductase alpha chain